MEDDITNLRGIRAGFDQTLENFKEE